MRLAVPRCFACRGFLDIRFTAFEEGSPHDSPGHQLVYSYGAIAWCRSCGAGQVERGSHDCYQFDEPWEMHAWYLLDPPSYEELATAFETCPRHTWPGCDCPIHRALAESVRSLPIRSRWTTVLLELEPPEELAEHVHPVALSWKEDGAPVLRIVDATET